MRNQSPIYGLPENFSKKRHCRNAFVTRIASFAIFDGVISKRFRQVEILKSELRFSLLIGQNRDIAIDFRDQA